MKDKEKQFKERIDCGIAYCEDTAIEEIKQDFKMKEKKNKQIEEMAEILLQSSYAWWRESPNGTTKKEYQANTLYNEGYRKLPEDTVVLTREEYNDLILAKKTFASDGEEVSSDTLLSTFKGIKEQARKETAEKIYWTLRKECFSPSQGYYKSDGFSAIDLILKDIIAKQFGVEIKE